MSYFHQELTIMGTPKDAHDNVEYERDRGNQGRGEEEEKKGDDQSSSTVHL
jgi:hypothetical protein